jgi:hypothetical protein
MRSRTLSLCTIAIALLAACAEDAPPVSSNGERIYADQQYYPVTTGTVWEYRIDTTSTGGQNFKDIGRRFSTIGGIADFDSVAYTIQQNRTVSGGSETTDTLFVRKNRDGVYLSTPGLRQLAMLPSFPGVDLGTIPREILLLPYAAIPGTFWRVFNFEFNQIPIFPIYFRVQGEFVGVQNVRTDWMEFKDCMRIRLSIDARFPNLQDPTNILNPLLIKESADFWFTHPGGLVLADGSKAVFAFLGGALPLSPTFGRQRLEVVSMNLVQPTVL